MSKASLLKKNIYTSYFYLLIASVYSLIITPLAIHYTSDYEYATYILISDFILWMGFFRIGIAPSVSAMLAQYLGKKDYKKIDVVISTSVILQLAIILMILIIGSSIAPFVLRYIGMNNTGYEFTIFIIAIIAYCVSLISQFLSAILSAHKLLYKENIVKNISILINLLLSITFIILGIRVVGLVLANLISVIIGSIILFKMVRRDTAIQLFYTHNFDKLTAKVLFNTGFWFSIGGVAGLLIMNLDRLVIAKIIDIELVVSYIITSKLYFLADKLLSPLINISRPYISHYFGSQQFDVIKRMYVSGTSFSLLAGSLFGVFILNINFMFIKYWVGSSYFIGEEANMLLCINFILQFAILPNRAVLASTLFELRKHNLIRIAEGVLNFTLSIILAKIYGLNGVIFASVISTILVSNIYMNKLCNRLFGSVGIIVDKKIYLSYFILFLPIFSYFSCVYFERYISLLIGAVLVSFILWRLVIQYQKEAFSQYFQ